jgi:hypothetical protein
MLESVFLIMAKFLYHEACNVCGSKDNKAVYADGSSFCFGCKAHTNRSIDIRKVFNPQPPTKSQAKDYPWDAQEAMPIEPLKWLLQYDLSTYEREKFGIQWSPTRQMICWKIKNPEGTIIGWQGRNFSPTAKAKYTSHGEIHKDLCILGDTHTKLVLVEDYISAIKVSKHLPCMPLFGCTISIESLQAIKDRFKGVIIWLDSDKLDNARKIALKASMLGLTGQVLFTELDPKCYNTNDIKSYLAPLSSEV